MSGLRWLSICFLMGALICSRVQADIIWIESISGTAPSNTNPFNSSIGVTVDSNLSVIGIGYGAGLSAAAGPNQGNDEYRVK